MPNNALSQYFPFLEKQSPESTEALSSTFAIASVGITMLKMLETLLPVAAGEVERESHAMADHFSTLVNYIKSQGASPERVANAISGMVMAMQFQDRNTQIMDNVAGMLERYRTMLEEICGNIDAMRHGEIASGHTINQAVDSILSSIRLTDIRTRYLEALHKAKGHTDESPQETPAETQDIELF